MKSRFSALALLGFVAAACSGVGSAEVPAGVGSTGGDAGASGAGGDVGQGAGGTDAGGGGTTASGGSAGTHGGAAGASGSSGATAGSAGNAGGGGTSGAAGSAVEAGGGEAGANAGAGGDGGVGGGGGAGASGGTAGLGGTSGAGGGGMGGAATGGSAGFATCATGSSVAMPTVLPVDIVWVVDNSASMAPAIDQVTQGINDFAALIGQKSLDYEVIMLSLRGKGMTTIGGKTRYAVCVPEPLAGDANCGDGTHFFQSSIDIKSTQPLEQFLGTLGQTAGYTAAEGPSVGGKGGDPWKQALRPEATKTIVVVSDDNSRLVADDFLHFKGGADPFNSTTLPPGILDPSWNGLFTSWTVDAIYGWGSDTDPSVACMYPDNTVPPSSGPTYTDLVTMSQGARAKICDGASAWAPFFDAVAKAVVATSKIDCTIAIPPDPDGATIINPGKVNVSIDTPSSTTLLPNVDGPSGPACDPQKGGWHYDDPQNPTKIILCQASCDAANTQIGIDKAGSIDVTFGCDTIKP